MDAAFKRNVKYVTMFQLKFFGMILAFGVLYGIFFGFMSDEGGKSAIRSAVGYLEMLLIIMPMSLQMRYVKWTGSFICSMGGTRKNVIWGQHIMTAELIAEAIILVAIVRSIFHMPWNNGFYGFYYYMMSYIIMMAVGIFGALLMDKWNTWGLVMCIVLGITFAMGYVFSAGGFGNGQLLLVNGVSVMENPICLLVMTLIALIVYAVAGLFAAKKFRRMEVTI